MPAVLAAVPATVPLAAPLPSPALRPGAPLPLAFCRAVAGAAASGAIAALVAAWLSAFTEPVVNRLLVQRCSFGEAIAGVKAGECVRFAVYTTFPTNMLKFPAFEAVDAALSFTPLGRSARGVVGGGLFCTLMLPVTNYRFRRSMGMPVEPGALYEAYPPTLIRDVVYGWSRGVLGTWLGAAFPAAASSAIGRAWIFGLAVFFSCVVSSPANEWRGYWLQPAQGKLPVRAFFKPDRYVRSTGCGATIIGFSLMLGKLTTPLAEARVRALCDNTMALRVSAIVAAILVVKKIYGRSHNNAHSA